MNKKSATKLLLIVLTAGWIGNTQASEPDWQSYSELLSTHVRDGTKNGVALARVDYAAIKRDPLWSKTVAELAQFAPS
ncbi:MAG: hypothetical protein GXP10_05715, partial [Gammaproteobacteria bacterium]|nr:hypothetical protein [Gammaproteobacteria bacterium]